MYSMSKNNKLQLLLQTHVFKTWCKLLWDLEGVILMCIRAIMHIVYAFPWTLKTAWRLLLRYKSIRSNIQRLSIVEVVPAWLLVVLQLANIELNIKAKTENPTSVWQPEKIKSCTIHLQSWNLPRHCSYRLCKILISCENFSVNKALGVLTRKLVMILVQNK